ncbi:WecB/TagA/CpsF family glycosyltransferase [Adhaeribacter soli]|uniref:WecB/TagA/CpsF family glycosyltransferase n=1 Tax=Adhaeribacter soli TaxID=2607655 RepID=A0A5N1J6A3_9BACT|nr:WecB/TagA/CpsF family glycosyltransferase [Adhaeribacter soli]KAA9340717.1 WecB/TagA/CpsF family glycosyltransferase [Adhaeribacter soli]
MTSTTLKKNRITLSGIPIDPLTMQQTLNRIDRSIERREMLHHVVVNAAKLVNAQKDPELKASIVNCDIINADGQAIVWAARLLNQPLPERVAGIDLMENLVKLAAEKKYKIFFLGAKEEVIQRMVAKYRALYGDEIIAGARNGYFKKEEEPQVARQIAESKADILFVAITSPKKEIFLDTYKELIKTPFIMGVGGSFDVVSGLVKRAPLWMQHMGLEWFYRLAQEPGRMWKRYLYGNSEFIYLILKEKLKQLF